MLVMPRPASRKAKPIAVRMDVELLDKLLAIGAKAPFKPTLTQLIETAVRQYIDAESDAKRPPKR